MSEDKDSRTEPASPRRRQESRKTGKVARSAEVSTGLVLLATMVTLWAVGPDLWRGFCSCCQMTLGHLDQADLTASSAMSVVWSSFATVLIPLAPVLLAITGISLVSGYGQVGFHYAEEALTPDLNKINPVKGMSQFISARSIVGLVTASVKVVVLLAVGYFTIQGVLPRLMGSHAQSPHGILSTIASSSLEVGLKASLALLIIAAADYFYQRWQYERDLRMTKQEVKEEHKLSEGDPQIMGRIRRMQYSIARRRMLADVKKADVIVRNPTHYAVALRYDAKESPAPVVLAKGADHMAMRILEEARKYNIPTHRDPPLAQALYKSVDVGQQIPARLYRIVARLLVQIYKLKNHGAQPRSAAAGL